MWVADQRNLNPKASIADIAAEVENDQQESVMKLAQTHDRSAQTVHATLYKDLQLSKKSARWVTKTLYKTMKEERGRVHEVILGMIAAAP
jgi:hypothetical protein